jgi:hypothetical protein
LETLEEIPRHMKQCLQGAGRDYAALDVDFHLAVAKSSKNQLLYELLAPIRSVLQDFIAKSQEMPGINENAHKHHAKILAAIRQCNPDRARRGDATSSADVRENFFTWAKLQIKTFGGDIFAICPFATPAKCLPSDERAAAAGSPHRVFRHEALLGERCGGNRERNPESHTVIYLEVESPRVKPPWNLDLRSHFGLSARI